MNTFQGGPLGCCTDDVVVDRLACQRVLMFAEKQPGLLAIAFLQIPLDRAKLVAWNGLLNRKAFLQQSHPEARLLKIHVGNFQGDSLADTQAVTVDQDGRFERIGDPEKYRAERGLKLGS